MFEKLPSSTNLFTFYFDTRVYFANQSSGKFFQGFESDLFYIVESGEFEATFSQVFNHPFNFTNMSLN